MCGQVEVCAEGVIRLHVRGVPACEALRNVRPVQFDACDVCLLEAGPHFQTGDAVLNLMMIVNHAGKDDCRDPCDDPEPGRADAYQRRDTRRSAYQTHRQPSPGVSITDALPNEQASFYPCDLAL